MYDICLKIIILSIHILLSHSQKARYNDTCNSTEECSDHRYICRYDEENVLRCLCDRFHTWSDDTGCVQIYNVTDILKEIVSVTDNFRDLEKEVDKVMKTHIAAGMFVFGMVIVATLLVSAFCIYVHIKDHMPRRSTINQKPQERFIRIRNEQRPLGLMSIV